MIWDSHLALICCTTHWLIKWYLALSNVHWLIKWYLALSNGVLIDEIPREGC